MRFAAAGRTSAVPGAAVGPSIYGVATVTAMIVEIGVFNTTTTAMAVGLVRATTTGTQGAAITRVREDDDVGTALATAFNTHTVAPTVGAQIRQASLGAAVGAGVIWTFGKGLQVDDATTSGIVVNCPTGTGQHLDFYFVWEE